MTILIACEQGSEEWLAARAGAGTASRAADMRSRMKVSRGRRKVGDFSEAAEKYAQLLAIERIAGQPLDSTFETWAMRRGRELEPVARQLYEITFGVMVAESGVMLTDDHLFGYSTDGEVVGERGGIEIKCPVASDKLAGAWMYPEFAEEDYIDQIDQGLWIAHWDWIDLVIYCPWLESVGKDLFVKRIWRDDNRIEALESDLVEFMRLSQRYESVLRADGPTRFERASTRKPAGDPPPWDVPAVPNVPGAALAAQVFATTPAAPTRKLAALLSDPFGD